MTQPELKKRPADLPSLRQEILEWISTSAAKITPAVFIQRQAQRHGLESNQIRALLKDLIARQELTYSYEHGCSFVQISFNKPVRISPSVVLKPPGYRYRPQPHDVVIQVRSGASFGDGRHPSTRLAIRGIEFALKALKPFPLNPESNVLDVGTGSGVLVMTAVRFGMQSGVAIDWDSCARAEARDNVKLNDLQARIIISDKTIEDIQASFSMVLANLRVPTLRKLCARIDSVLHPNGIVVFSGVRRHELAGLMTVYSAADFKRVWSAEEAGWAGAVIKKG